MSNAANILPALLPDPTKTSLPVPRLVTGEGSIGSVTYESFTMGGVQMPGQWLLVDCVRVFGWQILQAYGMSGASVIPIGDPLTKSKFSIKLWENGAVAQYRALLKTVLRKPVNLVPGSTKSAGMGIDQPQLLDMGIVAVVIWSVTPAMNPLVTSGGKGPWTATVELLEYRQPLPALPKPSQAIPDKAPPTPTAQDAADVEIQKLSQSQAALGAQLQQALSQGPKP